MVKVAPSLLSANFACLKDDIEKIENGKADWLHYDVMDGHFVPNISFGYSILKDVSKVTNLFLDVHLMISEPQKYVDEFIKSGFRESVYKREELGDTVLENSVALPHGDPATVINTSIIIMTLTNPIKWGNNYVDMIVMLAVPNNMESEFNQIVLEIYDLASNKNIINEIKKIANRADFINSLKE